MERTAWRILIVDDEPPLLRMMSLYLGRVGYTVTTTGATDEAWTLVEADPSAFDIAVIDGSMAGMTMLELASRMLTASPKLCVLGASGYPVDVSALAEQAPGRVAFLLKPFSPPSLAAALEGLLGGQEKDV